MSTPRVPVVPSDYDEAHAAGWTYHRNGISGCGFYAKVERGTLHVAWEVYDEEGDDHTTPVAASIPRSVLKDLARLDAHGPTRRHSINRVPATMRHVADMTDGRLMLHVFDMHEPGGIEGRILVVSDLIVGEDDRVAAFLLGELLGGDASTTLRGDVLHDEALTLSVGEEAEL